MEESDVSDGYGWWCRQCKGQKTIREGSFFSKSKLSLQKWVFLLVLWYKDAIDDAEIDTCTGVDLHQWLREVCSTKLLLFLDDQELLFRWTKVLFRHKP